MRGWVSVDRSKAAQAVCHLLELHFLRYPLVPGWAIHSGVWIRAGVSAVWKWNRLLFSPADEVYKATEVACSAHIHAPVQPTAAAT